ncbi:MAG TPA: TonB C-terminal domain-containing protein [Gemmatimonadales bacterium]|nr:TonB C-terminal domain-containing protein [Gemmatimonadales bacterium]
MRSSGKGERRVGGSTVGLITSLAVHGGLIAFLGGVVESAEPSPPVYAVELVAAPAPAPKQRLAPEATPTPPPPEPPAPEKSTPEPDVPSVPVKEPDRPIEPRPRADPAPKTSAPETPAPGETPSTGRDATTISTPGLDFPFPEYLRNVTNQIYRRWRRPTGNVPFRAEIFFLIRRDGSVADVRFVKRSGNFSYDLEAQGAIEAAAERRAFGPLPDGWPNDVLPISFYFEPRSQ